ncbi:MAG: hypothetical protein U9Q78_06145 [Chloroflexota bacterium]|nr:hypothetical protein [Chloroflexota bacterium]
MEFRRGKRGFSKLEYFLISLLVVIIAWTAWIMLEPVIRPAIERFIESALQAGTPTPTP